MAVVQISRIQMRRGRADTSGVPQLASGELGWAIDDQQLWIGNGAVSEGAPAVGNTRILTDNDGDVLLAAKYVALRGIVNTSADAGSDIEIDLEGRLDEHISVKSFGAVGDGLTDDTAALQLKVNYDASRLQFKEVVFDTGNTTTNFGNADYAVVNMGSVNQNGDPLPQNSKMTIVFDPLETITSAAGLVSIRNTDAASTEGLQQHLNIQ